MKDLLCMKDIARSFQRLDVALILAWYDIKLRYRRTKLGPIWITLTVIIESTILSILFGALFKEKFSTYCPYVFVGRIIWQLMAGIIGESLNAIVSAREYIFNNNLPPLIFILRIGIKNLIIFSHNAVFGFILIAAISDSSLSLWQLIQIPLVAVGLVLLLAPYGLIISLLGARFRDLNFLMPYCLQTLFYLTPVIWKIEQLPAKYAGIVKFNILATMLEFARNIFFNHPVSMLDLQHVYWVAVGGWVVAILSYNMNKNKMCYWVL